MNVSSGILPLKLNTGADKREIDRANAFLKSINYFWKGDNPFDIHIVCPDRELDEAKVLLNSINDLTNINTTFYSELSFFPSTSEFHLIPGMYKQQLVKLIAPTHLNLGGFLTFDADVLCIKPFSDNSFVFEGKLISKWERREIHSWWANSMSGIRAWTDLSAPGLGVTPNVLHSDLCNLIFKYFASRGKEAISELCRLTKNHPYHVKYEQEEGISLVWSEYSIYNIISEWYDLMTKYHISATDVHKLDRKIHSDRCVWRAADAHKLQFRSDDPGTFLIVQSWAGLAIEDVLNRIGMEFIL